MSGESAERHHHSGDDDVEDGSQVHVEGEHDPQREGSEGVDDAVLREFKETLDTGQHGSAGEREESASGEHGLVESGGESTADASEAESKHEASAVAPEGDGGDHELGRCLAEYQSTLNIPEAVGDAENERAEPEKQGSAVAEHGKADCEEAQDSGSGSDAQRRGDEEATTGNVEAKQRVESVNDQKTNSESNLEADGRQVEDQRAGTQVEGELGEQHAESPDRYDEYFPVRLSGDPEFFVGDGARFLVEEGIIPEKDEVRLDDSTVLSFDVSEGLWIFREDVGYRVVDVEHDRIGHMDLYRYTSDRGEEFLHIPDQDKLVPPTEMTWYSYPPNTPVYLDKDYKHELLEAAIDKAGGIMPLQREFHEQGTEITANFVYRHIHDLRDGMSEDKLIPILNYLGIDLNEVNGHIREIGHIGSVKNPELPFDLSDKHGVRLLSARNGDGTLSAAKDHGPTFHYANNDSVMRARIVESLTNGFSGAHILEREYNNGETAKVRTFTDIIGHALQRAGAVVGEIVVQNPHVPNWIECGSTENKREWLVQAFGDEGFVWANRGKVCIGRSVELSSILSDDMIHRLNQMDWRSTHINGVFVDDIRPCKDLPTHIRESIKEHPVNLLVEEKKMLEDLGIITEMYPSEIHRGRHGDYSAHWILQTKTREDTRRFYDKVGFPQERKQDKLRSALRLER